MSIISIVLPKMGEAIHEATLVKWLKKKGENVNKGESIAEVATDKIDTEIVATETGIIEEFFFEENDVIPVGEAICSVSINANKIESEPKVAKTPIVEKQTPKIPNTEKKNTTPSVPKIAATKPTTSTTKLKNSFLSPLLKKIIEKEQISQEELSQIKGTGLKNRITKDDIYNYLDKRNDTPTSTETYISSTKIEPIVSNPIGVVSSVEENVEKIPMSSMDTQNVEILEMDRMRKIIAKHMVDSKNISAHVTSFAEVDVTKIVEWRNKNKKKILEDRNIKLTYTPIFLEAVVQSLLKFPLLNSSVQGDKIYIKKNIHLGIATALPNNNLIVPVIKFAEGYNFLGLATQIEQLSLAARIGKLLPDQIQEGTFTVTNLGSIKMMTGTPIINQPQVAILGLGTVKKRPIVKETPEEDIITIGHMMYLSFSYDHRIIDGKLAGDFLYDLTQRLENFSFPTV